MVYQVLRSILNACSLTVPLILQGYCDTITSRLNLPSLHPAGHCDAASDVFLRYEDQDILDGLMYDAILEVNAFLVRFKAMRYRPFPICLVLCSPTTQTSRNKYMALSQYRAKIYRTPLTKSQAPALTTLTSTKESTKREGRNRNLYSTRRLEVLGLFPQRPLVRIHPNPGIEQPL
ncbi:hypothetical protein BC939DRAFT_298506 [Gamsiella multidivaricata]|uniref:uncharacterized protein n=1 Tax=Gamsiella multidivaricata TaxID=101098 RepID=UPI002220227A|nr:uncharacterized protein BC939DRAFT_298240 [Gamsiella multidivaricata]XP_051408248.1 uncharacterized protein BC939DRAFT_298506 [Gamsiella multidivaricata]KAI7818213.1 hypothetical protein BC939DRAFT_298240 [Gamsiella multidivaricata]KAI7818229.1 hypothetical protein BC939DRAFT_298506 [Gamsiella multidivaricata]